MRRLAFVLGLACWAPLLLAGEFQAWKQESRQQFRDYREAQDRQFGEYLDKQWREYRAFHGEVRDTVPKPVVPPAVVPTTPAPPVTPAPAPLAPVTPAPVTPPAAPAATLPGAIPVACFGMEFQLPSLSLPLLKGSVDAAAIGRWWKQASEQDDGKASAALAELRGSRHLSDWGMRLLVNRYATAAEGNRNTRIARQWYYLTRLGYQTRVALEDGQLVLLARTDRQLYETPYLQVDGNRYYLIEALPGGSNRFYTYEGDHPAAAHPFSMVQQFSAWDAISPDRTRRLTFAWGARSYTLEVNYNQGLVDYLGALPPTELAVYFNTRESFLVHRQLEEQLRPLLKGRNEEQAVDFLLAFVQKAFVYETDEQQFGREHYMFADETIHYPWSDCEDRAILFARLVRELVGVRVVGVSWPGHVATAVALPKGAGKRILWRDTSYLIADPTYIGATVGMAMPQFAEMTPEVIEIP